jgi:hypothetical protein
MNDEQPHTSHQITGQMRSMFYLVDEPTTFLTSSSMGSCSPLAPLVNSPWISAHSPVARLS